MTNREELAHQVSTTLGDHVDDFDIPKIVDDLIEAVRGERLQSIDELSPAEYWAIVERHDTSV